jgi:hypothetical protein
MLMDAWLCVLNPVLQVPWNNIDHRIDHLFSADLSFLEGNTQNHLIIQNLI